MPKDDSVQLPEQWEAHTISSMMPSDKRWTFPSSMSVDLKGFCWLDPDAPVFLLGSEGDEEVIVIFRDNNGFSVFIPEEFSLRWYRQDLSPDDGEEEIEWISIQEIHELPKE